MEYGGINNSEMKVAEEIILSCSQVQAYEQVYLFTPLNIKTSL